MITLLAIVLALFLEAVIVKTVADEFGGVERHGLEPVVRALVMRGVPLCPPRSLSQWESQRERGAQIALGFAHGAWP